MIRTFFTDSWFFWLDSLFAAFLKRSNWRFSNFCLQRERWIFEERYVKKVETDLQ
jgi:hypothetical protein